MVADGVAHVRGFIADGRKMSESEKGFDVKEKVRDVDL